VLYVVFILAHTGIVYITYSKSSEAALAIEEMNAKSLPNHPKPVKVKKLHNSASLGSRPVYVHIDL